MAGVADRSAFAVLPRSAPYLDEAVRRGGGTVVPVEEAGALIWTSSAAPDDLATVVREHPDLAWIQLPWAGVEPYLSVMDPDRTWTNAKEVYAPPVAEHALALLLAGFRHLDRYARAGTWSRKEGRNLFGARVVVLGGGGIARSFVDLIAPFRCDVTVVRRHDRPFEGARRVLTADRLHDALRDADAVVLALPLLDDTQQILGADELALLAPGAWVVNVARGGHVDTDALVASIEAGRVGGAGLDVTDPEPLPDDHPLWRLPTVIVTPHTGNTPEMAVPLLGAHITENVRRWIAGEPLLAQVDLTLGY